MRQKEGDSLEIERFGGEERNGAWDSLCSKAVRVDHLTREANARGTNSVIRSQMS